MADFVVHEQLIQAGKGEALRIRAILRSLVPIEDLVGVISLPLQIPAFGKGEWDLCLIYILCILYLNTDILCIMFILIRTQYILYNCLTLDNSIIEPKMSASFVPDHKAPMVLFLDRVYGIDNQDFLLHVLEVGFLPDMRAAASLDTVCMSKHHLFFGPFFLLLCFC